MEWLKQYRYPIIAGLIGVFLACLIVSFGFFKTIFVLILEHWELQLDYISKKTI